jgi:hypothetical protein
MNVIFVRCARAVSDTVELLRNDSHEMVLFTVPEPMHAVSLLFKAIISREYALSLFRGNHVDEHLRYSTYMIRVCADIIL